jgi:rRNA maturation RNase YbeY
LRALALCNRQRVRRVNLRRLRQVVSALLRETWPQGDFDLAIQVLAAAEMTRLNEAYLHHRGPTDVITFDYAPGTGPGPRTPDRRPSAALAGRRPHAYPGCLHGEIFVCLDEAVSQARRFHTTWQSELVRYIAHGLLHLLGYNDAHPRVRRRMKRAEDALLRRLARQFDFHGIGSN